ncbi:hypothetical protein L6164_003300 [Bauhinia variegata]|uniref:Uncharacterized protein n=1 Tax=Bauhinia variegata TaxID=167791 RepID=A0ACB9Q6D7_BAUVA|nr:hypothetical protein L6164_003300 [Bauhinia variegata]
MEWECCSGRHRSSCSNPHFAQILYFSLVSGFLAFTSGSLSTLFSVAHPYLIADNWHYPFYLEEGHHGSLGKYRNKVWMLAYFLGTAAVLVPAPLIEFRHYKIPLHFTMI